MSEMTMSFGQYLVNIWRAVSSVAQGMWITFRYVWAHKPVTVEYPEVREVLPERSRGRLYNDVGDCISCNQCAMVCPVDCIYIASHPRPQGEEIPKTTNGTPLRLVLDQFTIDEALCCYCGLCTTVCPTECLTHTKDYEFSQYTLDHMKYDYLDPEIIAWRDRIVGD